jgi:DNA invertase Pin-like site-specific DNA recombinase
MNVIIYARYSSDGQREESVEGQLRECKEYAERHNMTVVECYIDRAQSARMLNEFAFRL